MTDNNDLIEFDDSEAIEFIMNRLSPAHRQVATDETIQYVLDLICEYYDQNGLIEDDTVDEAEIAEDDMLNFVFASIKKEKIFDISEEMLQEILDREYDYGVNIGIYS